jgi:hypothetical protein
MASFDYDVTVIGSGIHPVRARPGYDKLIKHIGHRAASDFIRQRYRQVSDSEAQTLKRL